MGGAEGAKANGELANAAAAAGGGKSAPRPETGPGANPNNQSMPPDEPNGEGLHRGARPEPARSFFSRLCNCCDLKGPGSRVTPKDDNKVGPGSFLKLGRLESGPFH